VNQSNSDATELKQIATVVSTDVAVRDARDLDEAFDFEFVGMDGHGLSFEKCCEAFDLVSEDFASDMILVVVRDECANDLDLVFRRAIQ
jgi:hypothetical protein